MEPSQPAPPTSNYDFIMHPPQAPKPGLPLPLGGNSFVMRIVFLVGGAVVVIALAAVLINLFFGGRNNLSTLITLTQTEQEIVRLSLAGKNAASQDVKNAAVNTELSVKSQQQTWLAFLGQRGTKVDAKLLDLKKDLSVDGRLDAAEKTSTFDTAFTSVMRTQLEAYASALKTAYEGTANRQQRALLSAHYDYSQLLLEQWPSSTLGLVFY